MATRASLAVAGEAFRSASRCPPVVPHGVVAGVFFGQARDVLIVGAGGQPGQVVVETLKEGALGPLGPAMPATQPA
jgi:hypothetical protein